MRRLFNIINTVNKGINGGADGTRTRDLQRDRLKFLKMEIEDQEENEFSVERYLRIFSSYTYENVKFWVITEADRSATTILLPSEDLFISSF